MSKLPASPTPDTRSLRTGVLGVPSIVFFVVAAAAPLAASLGAGPVVFIFAGPGAPAMYLAHRAGTDAICLSTTALLVESAKLLRIPLRFGERILASTIELRPIV